MGVDRGNKGTGSEEQNQNNTNQTNNVGGNNNTNQTNQKTRGSAFAASGILAKGRSFIGSEEVTKLVDGMKELSSKATPNAEIAVIPLDKTVMPKLAYSTVVYATKFENKVAYYLILIEKTGKQAPTAIEIQNKIVESLNPMARANKNTNIDVPSDALNKPLLAIAEQALRERFPKEQLISVDGCIIPSHVEITIERINSLTSLAYTATVLEAYSESDEIEPINLANELAALNGNGQFAVYANTTPLTLEDAAGMPLRQDWLAKLVLQNTNNVAEALNVESGDNDILTVGGTLDFLIAKNTIAGPNNVPIEEMRIQPHLCINTIDTGLPGIETTLLGIVSALVMTSQNNYVPVVRNMAAEKRGIEALNIVANLGNEENGIGSPLDLSDKSFTNDDRNHLVSKLFSSAVKISIDVQSAGVNSWAFGVFGYAASGNTYAAKAIVNAAVNLTNGAFPKDFPINKLFAHECSVIPSGLFTDNTNTKRDAKDINLATVCQYSNGDVATITKWDASAYPVSITRNQLPPFIARSEVISKIVADARIYGKDVRVPFSGEFVEVLKNAVTNTGLNPLHSPAITLEQQNPLGTFFSNDYAVGTYGFQSPVGGTGYGNNFGNFGGINRGYGRQY